MIRLLFISLLFISCGGNISEYDKSQIVSYQAQVETIKQDSLLVGIQEKINNAFAQSFITKKNDELNLLDEKLENLYATKKNNIILYWKSYLKYYSSIYYSEKGDEETSEKEIDKGIDWLKEMKNKNSEDYALLAMLQGFGIQFKGMKAMFISGRIEDNLKKALSIDASNLRAYYVSASNDFYTPEMYGGGKMAEEYLLKAISLSAQKIKNDYLPSWGKEESYVMLIKLYIKNEKWDLAKKYFKEGNDKYPENYSMIQLASQLIGK